jgi:glucuronate isomerase
MSMEDGLVLQLHPGSWREHNPTVRARFGPDKGADIPTTIDFVGGLKALLDRFGNEAGLTFIVYTLDEATFSRELAPLAGHYPALRLGPPWWFLDSPEGIRRFRGLVTETAGFANTVGFNDDARSLLSIPARHDMVRRLDAGFLAGLVAEHRLDEQEATEVAEDLAYHLARRAFRVI